MIPNERKPMTRNRAARRVGRTASIAARPTRRSRGCARWASHRWCSAHPTAGVVQSWYFTTLAFLPNPLRKYRERAVFFPPLVKGGLGGVGRVTVACTTGHKLGALDASNCTCAASTLRRACRIETSLRANGEFTDDAEALRPTPPNPPFTRGGKAHHRSFARNKSAPWTFVPPTPSIPTFRHPTLRLASEKRDGTNN